MNKLVAALLLSVTLTLTAETTSDLPRLRDAMDVENSVTTNLHWFMPDDVLSGTEDAIYISPTADDIQILLKFYRWRREGFSYIDEAWDCDNFAREFKYWADVWAVRQYRAQAGVTVAMAYVEINGDISDIFPGSHQIATGYHVLNAILRADGQWLFFEPQTGCLVPVESLLYEGSITILKITL